MPYILSLSSASGAINSGETTEFAAQFLEPDGSVFANGTVTVKVKYNGTLIANGAAASEDSDLSGVYTYSVNGTSLTGSGYIRVQFNTTALVSQQSILVESRVV